MDTSSIVGNKTQEEKIEEMAELAHELFPHIKVISFKGAFRFGVKQALKELGYENWKDIYKKNTEVRIKFFETALKFSENPLKGFKLSHSDIENLKIVLEEDNKKFIEKHS